MKELQRQASPNIVMALAGNKADMANKRTVDYEEAQVLIFSLSIDWVCLYLLRVLNDPLSVLIDLLYRSIFMLG